MTATLLIATLLHYTGIYTFHSIDYLMGIIAILAIKTLIKTIKG